MKVHAHRTGQSGNRFATKRHHRRDIKPRIYCTAVHTQSRVVLQGAGANRERQQRGHIKPMFDSSAHVPGNIRFLSKQRKHNTLKDICRFKRLGKYS